jgi:hypothetical protein
MLQVTPRVEWDPLWTDVSPLLLTNCLNVLEFWIGWSLYITVLVDLLCYNLLVTP